MAVRSENKLLRFVNNCYCFGKEQNTPAFICLKILLLSHYYEKKDFLKFGQSGLKIKSLKTQQARQANP
jgi:hypothetical protein